MRGTSVRTAWRSSPGWRRNSPSRSSWPNVEAGRRDSSSEIQAGTPARSARGSSSRWPLGSRRISFTPSSKQQAHLSSLSAVPPRTGRCWSSSTKPASWKCSARSGCGGERTHSPGTRRGSGRPAVWRKAEGGSSLLEWYDGEASPRLTRDAHWVDRRAGRPGRRARSWARSLGPEPDLERGRRRPPWDRDSGGQSPDLPGQVQFGRDYQHHPGNRDDPPLAEHHGRDPSDRQRRRRARGFRSRPSVILDTRSDQLPKHKSEDEERKGVAHAPDDAVPLLRRNPFSQARDESFDSVLEQVAPIEGDRGQRVRRPEHQVQPEEPVQCVREEPEEGRWDRRCGPLDWIEMSRGRIDRRVAGEGQRDVGEKRHRNVAELAR